MKEKETTEMGEVWLLMQERLLLGEINSTIDLLLPTSQVKVCSDSNIFCICEKSLDTLNFIYALFHYLIWVFCACLNAP